MSRERVEYLYYLPDWRQMNELPSLARIEGIGIVVNAEIKFSVVRDSLVTIRFPWKMSHNTKRLDCFDVDLIKCACICVEMYVKEKLVEQILAGEWGGGGHTGAYVESEQQE